MLILNLSFEMLVSVPILILILIMTSLIGAAKVRVAIP